MTTHTSTACPVCPWCGAKQATWYENMFWWERGFGLENENYIVDYINDIKVMLCFI